MFHTLRIRLTAVCSAVTIIVLCGITLAALRISERQVELQASQAFTSNLNAICYYMEGKTIIDTTWLSQTEASDNLLIRMHIDGVPITYTHHNPDRARLTALAHELAQEEHSYSGISFSSGSLDPEIHQFFVEEEGERYWAAVCRIVAQTNQVLEVIVVKSTARERAQVFQLRCAFTGCIAVGALCLALFAWNFTKRVVRPVEEARRQQIEFVSAASHELRSPLAVMKVSMETLPGVTGEKQEKLIKLLEEECDRLSQLAKDLLTLAGADADRWTVGFRLSQPEIILMAVGEHFSLPAEEKGVTLQVDLPQHPLRRCSCDPFRMEQLLIILVDNALRFTPAGGKITLKTESRGRKTLFAVADTGPGIPDAEKARVFDRFYKCDISRTNREHYGMGLSIAWEIAKAHNGTLWVEDNPGGGALFILQI